MSLEQLPSEIHQLISGYLIPKDHLIYTKSLPSIPPWRYSGRAINCDAQLEAQMSKTDNFDWDIAMLLLSTNQISAKNRHQLFLEAIYRGNQKVVVDFLADSKFDPAAYDNKAIKTACYSLHLDILKLLLADPRVDPSANSNEAMTKTIQIKENRGFQLAFFENPDPRAPCEPCPIIEHYIKVLELLRSDPRVKEKLK